VGGEIVLAYEPTLLPRQYLGARSQSYLFPGGNRIKQLHKETRFGTVIIDEFKDSIVTLESPNITVAGRQATFTYIRYRGGGKWATAIYAPAHDRHFIVEADRRLEGAERDAFIELVESLVLGARR